MNKAARMNLKGHMVTLTLFGIWQWNEYRTWIRRYTGKI